MRVVVKNLPPGVTGAALKKHFSDRGTPTDVRLLTDTVGESRRVAFLGYKTQEATERSILYYNKSYYNGQRITMEEVRHRAEEQEDDYPRKGQRPFEVAAINAEEMKEIVKLITKKKETAWNNEADEAAAKQAPPKETVEEVIQKYQKKTQEANKQKVLDTGEVFVHGIPYEATEEEVEAEFSKYGPVAEVYLKQKSRVDAWGDGETLNCGHVIIQYTFPKDAYALLSKEIIFQGRNVKVLPSKGKPEVEVTSKNKSNLSRGKYNALFFNFSAVLGIAAKEKKVSKTAILKDRGTGLGGRMALLESELIERTKIFIREEGIAEECSCQKQLCTCMFVSKKSLLVKNLPYNTTEFELKQFFRHYLRLVFSPSKTLAVLEYVSKSDAVKELKNNNFSKIRDHPIYVEHLKVTKERYIREASGTVPVPVPAPGPAPSTVPGPETSPSTKLIIKNVPFQAGRSELSEILEGLVGKEFKLRIPQKPDGSHRGFCFVEVDRQELLEVLLDRLRHIHLYGRHLVTERAQL
ncbi:multiple RNA-binding domain-containing protein 1 [Nematocida displodere]|uniref:Multiple RNA-binding domain-containing protein 1 n=1 Tax=Nematocida displodere TaxID=1805483 RepID=A0A177EDN0_9MICR|nr:multiple RNA-binding domain-containing protein 1 [Nematocida displodere]